MLQMRLSGSGGQGLILLGIIIAEAAIIDNKLAVQTQSYGPEARGGASKSEVIISNNPIHFPKVINPNLLLSLTQESVNKYSSDLAKDGILIVDKDFVKDIPSNIKQTYVLPIIQKSKSELGKVLFANIIALGVITSLVQPASDNAIKNALLARVPKGTEDINIKAFQIGKSLVN